ncbi:hypothetical protein BTH42_25375 [Burkholderia sp. SRS-W-2-2016]|uniref:contact-dependent growth inhibition system immunity protein n=1 Tax=Burkholderia sp. SRS-W-2-2016 TaxID=1926878 RepID=UPI00094B06D4|nr:contact-dependent growth inhibition system immunity protein [Burkholderia sp. SRS-W-2-2016]OLL28888.1 hypothetical protein BTH42_25375 [Burkholderia sp. SRS-W-2-2016]
MISQSHYPNLDSLIRGYFNEDFDLWGNTVAEVLCCFKEENDPVIHTLVATEIERFKRNHSANLDKSFEKIYGLYVDPEPWGHSTVSFLEELKRLLRE